MGDKTELKMILSLIGSKLHSDNLGAQIILLESPQYLACVTHCLQSTDDD